MLQTLQAFVSDLFPTAGCKYEGAGGIWGIITTLWLGRYAALTVPSCRPAADSKPIVTRPVAIQVSCMKDGAMNDSKPLSIGDRVQLRRYLHIQGYVWDTGWPDMVIIKWDDPEENAYIRNPDRDLQKVTV